ncbi:MULTISPECIES: M29 family peptidase [unclassified Cupriavidus]|uniref:M29 family peptidase n=1 Tax=unclassified Cupriavidus TaxID=2640874 RepID=UPI0003BF7BA2|nr:MULTISPECIES: M29 family peptidase [unclassified Cupriavidus]ESJ23832.1 M29 family peptidase [Cupriavidus sp. HPC(L)]MCD9120125.1 peptidase M29 [Cupriavidus sp. UGS-1]
MLVEQIEHRWLAAFRRTLELCALSAGEVVGIVSESQSRQVIVDLAELAVQALGATPIRVRVPTPALQAPAPVRSTGASDALQQLEPVIAALSRCHLVLDCTVEGLLHAPELPRILRGADGVVPRLLMISNEHPEILERCVPDPELETGVRAAMRRLRGASEMRVSSGAGTDLRIGLAGARVGGVWGYCNKPGQVAHWPGGLCLAFPATGQVNGTLVLAPGDVNLTFKTYLRDTVVCHVEHDYIVGIEGNGVDADMMRGYYAAWADKEGTRAAYAVSHVGWGMNPQARWDALTFYDRRDCNGTELRAFAGNFLYSTGANEVAGRHTLGHFDLPLRGCTVTLDGVAEVEQGRLAAMPG